MRWSTITIEGVTVSRWRVWWWVIRRQPLRWLLFDCGLWIVTRTGWGRRWVFRRIMAAADE